LFSVEIEIQLDHFLTKKMLIYGPFKYFSAFDAAASEWMRCENGNRRRSDREAKIPVEDLPSQKRINTELFIDREMMLYIQKMRRDRIKVIGSRNGIGSR